MHYVHTMFYENQLTSLKLNWGHKEHGPLDPNVAFCNSLVLAKPMWHEVFQTGGTAYIIIPILPKL